MAQPLFKIKTSFKKKKEETQRGVSIGNAERSPVKHTMNLKQMAIIY